MGIILSGVFGPRAIWSFARITVSGGTLGPAVSQLMPPILDRHRLIFAGPTDYPSQPD